MEYKIVEHDEFYVVGINVKTSNVGKQGMKNVAELWGEFLMQDVPNSIPNKTSNDIICCYVDHEYENNTFRVIIGCKVASLDSIPDGYIGWMIPACKYRRYNIAGAYPNVLMNAWEYIWKIRQDNNIGRGTNFELYREDTLIPDFYINTEYAEIDMYISEQ